MRHGVQDAGVDAFVPDGKLQEFFSGVHLVAGNLERAAEPGIKLFAERPGDAVGLNLQRGQNLFLGLRPNLPGWSPC